jgi:hypothetical protein
MRGKTKIIGGFDSQLVIESLDAAVEYNSVMVDPGEAIKADLAFDPSDSHLYVLTSKKVTFLLISHLFHCKMKSNV